MTRWTAAVWVLLLALSGIASEGIAREGRPVERILERALQASGGAAALEAIRGIKLKGTIHLKPLNLNGVVTQYQQGRDQFYMRQFIPVEGYPGGGLEEVFILNGEQGILRSDLRGTRSLSEAEVRSAQLMNDPSMVFRFGEYFSKPKYLGKVTIRGEAVEGIEVSNPVTGKPMQLYFSEETGHLVSMAMTIVSEEMEIRANVTFSNFQEVEGVVFPHTSRMELAIGTTEIQITEIVINPEFNADRFNLERIE